MKKLKADLVSATGAILEFLGQYPKRPILLAIDGRCGSGKTTLAGALEKEAGGGGGGEGAGVPSAGRADPPGV